MIAPRTFRRPDGDAWLQALAEVDLVVRASFDDDAMLGAAKRLGPAGVVARATPASRVDVISFPRRDAYSPTHRWRIPPQAARGRRPGRRPNVVAGTLAAAEALSPDRGRRRR